MAQAVATGAVPSPTGDQVQDDEQQDHDGHHDAGDLDPPRRTCGFINLGFGLLVGHGVLDARNGTPSVGDTVYANDM
jgi:hypothetical protein